MYLNVLELVPKLKVRLHSKYYLSDSGCWNLKKSKSYGMMRVDGKLVLAHRLFYAAFYGKDPGDMLVCHKCDNPRCVNPDHLFLGTHKDNAKDKSKKGRCRQGYSRSRTRPDCNRGHLFTPDNTVIRKNGTRQCLACTKIRYLGYREPAP